jgi:hypothetical protein
MFQRTRRAVRRTLARVSTATLVDDPSGFTPTALSDLLQHAGLDAVVREVAVTPVGTGQMAACYRLDINYERGDGPARLVAKLPSPDPAVRAAVAPSYRTEVRFYRELAPDISRIAPHCYLAAASDDGTAFTLLLEDMAPALPGDQLAGCTAEDARDAAFAVARLHAARWADPTVAGLDWLIPPMTALATGLGPLLRQGAEDFIGKRRLDDATAGVFRGFGDRFGEWATARPVPSSLLHNDYRLDNLLFAPAGNTKRRVTAVDWQSLSTGMPLRDIAFLLGTGLSTDDRRVHEREIVRAYHEALRMHGVNDYGLDQCWDDYRYSLFQGPFICIMGEAFAKSTERGTQMFSVMAERSAAAIVELESFDLLTPSGE